MEIESRAGRRAWLVYSPRRTLLAWTNDNKLSWKTLLLLLVLQGWIDTIYMNPEGTFRLARGNKGTLFIREYCLEQQHYQQRVSLCYQFSAGAQEQGPAAGCRTSQ